jgi:DnaJ-class molecular chaperone
MKTKVCKKCKGTGRIYEFNFGRGINVVCKKCGGSGVMK